MTVQVSKVTSVRLCWIWFRSILWVESALEPHSLEVCNQWVSGQLLLNLSVRINAKRAETAGKYQRATPAQSMETKTNAATLAKNVFFFHSSQDYFWTKKCKEVLPGTKFLPGTCLLAQTSCQEPASSQKIPARNLLPRRKFLPGTCFLAENSCQEASSWHRTCAGRRFPSASLPVQTCQTHMYFQEIGTILAHILYLNLFLSYFLAV